MNERSGFGIRLGAMILDGVLVSVGGFLVGGTIGGMLGGLVGGAGGSTMLQLEEFANNPEAQAAAGAMAGGMAGGMIGWVLGVVLFTLIYMLIEAFTGASP